MYFLKIIHRLLLKFSGFKFKVFYVSQIPRSRWIQPPSPTSVACTLPGEPFVSFIKHHVLAIQPHTISLPDEGWMTDAFNLPALTNSKSGKVHVVQATKG